MDDPNAPGSLAFQPTYLLHHKTENRFALLVIMAVFVIVVLIRDAKSAGHAYTTMSATAYCLRGHTASGTYVHSGTVAVNPRQIRLGTRLYVSGYGYGRAEDTGSAIGWGRLDLWFPSCAAAWRWGRRTVRVTIYR